MKTKKKRLYQTNLLFLVIGILLSLSAGFHLYIVLAKQQRSDVEKLSTIYAERTESLINGIFHKTDVLAAAVKLENGDISQEEFDTLAQLVYQENSGIRGIQYMPGAVVTYSYPIEGNEAVIGKNFLEIPERKKDVLLAIDTKKIALSGPYQLLQGGLGVVARNPIFLYDDAGREYFWGFSAIVLNLPDALQDAQLAHLNDSGYDFQLYNINENEERIVIAGDENLDTSKAICSAVSVPNHEWTLAIASHHPWVPTVAGIGAAAAGIFITIILWNVLQLMQKEKAAVAAKDEFFSNISHDMRTPLNAVLGFTKLAKEPGLSQEEKNTYLNKIESSGQLLLELVNDTLMFSKGSNGKLQVHPEPCTIYQLGYSILNPLKELARSKNIHMIISFQKCPDHAILADRLFVQKIFLNLITNAIKYTPAGGHVWLIGEEEAVSNMTTHLVFRIKDDGIGMSDEFQKNMFEPFLQENRAGYESSGTGLGLAIVKQTVELMHGTIEVQSQLNEGSEFIVHLQFPLIKEDAVPQAPAPQALNLNFLAGKKILVCEDNALNLEIAKALLTTKDMQVITAANGSLGVDAFTSSSENEIDAILMDLRMPVMDGLSAAKAIRACKRSDAKRVPIIAMTADVFLEDVQKCKAAGMDAHVAKPIKPERLYAVLIQEMKRK